MKQIVLSVFLAVILFGRFENAKSQPIKMDEKKLIEKFRIFTDRDLYMVDDKIQFFVENLSPQYLKNPAWSKVLYVELIAYDGTPVLQDKFPLSDVGAEGTLTIPEKILSGNYYLKSYTKWMRNYGPLFYSYKPVSILNFYTDTVILAPENYTSDFDVKPVSSQLESIIKPLNNKNWKKRQNMDIKLSDLMEKDDQSTYLFSLVNSDVKTFDTIEILPKNPVSNFNFNYLPETRGLSISGKLAGEKGSDVSDYKIYLSIFDGSIYGCSAITDSTGKFAISFPDYWGNKKIFISYLNNSGKDYQLLVDNDFSSEKVNLPFIPMNISEAQKQTLKSIIYRSVVNSKFRKDIPLDYQEMKARDFYTEPTLKLVLSDYIEMPHLEDYFYELISFAGVRHQKDKNFIQVLGPYSELNVYPPMVLLDGVLINDIDELLKISPLKVKSIEVFNKPVIQGDVTYGGLVNIFSNDGDLAGMNLPKSGLFFDYKMFKTESKPDSLENLPVNIPLMKNTLYWKALDKNHQGDIRFNTGDVEGNYIMMLKKIDSNGNVSVDTQEISIE